jgi:ubiquinone/menaquinone biosynthesis C-methylase UbiE
MHKSARENGVAFFDKYLKGNFEGKKVLDVGSLNINGSLRYIFPQGQYTGIDMVDGNGVDIVCNAHEMPFSDESFDAVISTSCFEHDEMFWLTFLEMCRVAKPEGFIYMNAPNNGKYHGHPGDCWRFYEDSGKALETWAVRSGYNVKLIENYIDRSWPYFHNCVNIWKKELRSEDATV